LKTVFSGLAKFSNLKILRLDFHNCYQEEGAVETSDCWEDPTHFLKLQSDIFTALAAHPLPSLVSMALNNLLAIPDEIYAKEEFQQIFRSLEELHVSVLSDTNGEGSYYQEPLVEFWETSVPHVVRSAVALTALTIRSDLPVGSGPMLTTKDLFHPHLASLALHQFKFDPALPDSDMVAFILRHKATLTRLELHGCSIDGGEDGEFPRPWNAVLKQFETELGALREFVLQNENETESDEDAVGRDPRFEYTRLNAGFGFMPWDEEVDTEDLDLPALESLMAVVESRGGKRDTSDED
jgi:hypothetical protein